MNFDVVIIGSGPAGSEAAIRLAKGGSRVAVVSMTPPGGRATVGSLVPSKVWLHAAHGVAHQRGAVIDAAAIAERARSVVAARVAWTAANLESAGVDVIVGEARVSAPGSVDVTADGATQRLTCDHIVIATGSEPRFSGLVRPDGVRVIAPRMTKDMTHLPATMVVVGGGITGIEYGSAFAGLGVDVTLLAGRDALRRFDRGLVDVLMARLSALGVRVRVGERARDLTSDDNGVTVTAESGSPYRAEMAFIGTGREADTKWLGEELRDGMTLNDGFIVVDSVGRTAVDGIWACGDVVGAPLTANKALYQARTVADSILGRDAAIVPASQLIEAVYTSPQLAEVGGLAAARQRADVRIEERPYRSSVLADIHDAEGVVFVAVDEDDAIVAAGAVGESAADVLAPVQLAIHAEISWSRLQALPFAYPTFTEVVTTVH